MEDGGTIGQWANNEKSLYDVDDVISKLSVTSPGGTSQFFGASSTPLEAPGRSSVSLGSAKGGKRRSPSKDKRASGLRLPSLTGKRGSPQRTAKIATGKAATGKAATSSSAKLQKATGSASSTPTPKKKQKGGGEGKRKGRTLSVSGKSSRSSSISKRPSRSGAKPRAKSASSASASPRSLSRKSSKRGGSSARASKGKKGVKGAKGKKAKKGRQSPAGSSREGASAELINFLTSLEMERRVAIAGEQEAEHNTFLPDYNLLGMNLVRAQLQEVNQRQRSLNEAFKVFQAHGIHLGGDHDVNGAMNTLRAQVQAEMRQQIDDARVENLSLRSLLDEKNTELEQKNTELQGLRDKVNRKLMRFEVESESLKAEVQSALRTNQLDVDRMKRELGHRLDVATAAFRTPKYDTALRSMQELVRSVQEEIQEHHDILTKLILFIGAQDTFLREKTDSMHTNFPTRYRDELRKLEKDRLLNILDVLSFNDTVVETVGKTLYVMQRTEHNTNVF